MKAKAAIKTGIVGAAGGGVAAVIAAISDPAKYSFPRDLGAGKLWPFFLQGAGVGIAALLLKSPFGQKVMSSVQQAKAQAQQDQTALADAKTQFKSKADK